MAPPYGEFEAQSFSRRPLVDADIEVAFGPSEGQSPTARDVFFATSTAMTAAMSNTSHARRGDETRLRGSRGCWLLLSRKGPFEQRLEHRLVHAHLTPFSAFAGSFIALGGLALGCAARMLIQPTHPYAFTLAPPGMDLPLRPLTLTLRPLCPLGWTSPYAFTESWPRAMCTPRVHSIRSSSSSAHLARSPS